MIYKNILNTIGETPSIKLQNIAINDTELYVKAEYFNPASSVKDRLALSIIENAEKNNLLKKNQTVVEATSGNTGIGLAMVCAAKKYDLVVTMPDSASIERRKLMRFLGAKVILTPAAEGGTGAYNLAKELVKKNDWFFAKQFENQDNAKVHEQTTGQEIYNDFKNIGLDYWVSGYGTGGTFTGVSRILRKKMPNTKSAIRRVRRVKKQTRVNRIRKSKYKNATKKMDLLLKSEKKAEAKKFFSKFQSILMQVAKSGVVNKKTASRKISKISKKIK